ncbi:MAG TPA: type II secretion system F family protein [Planctomycetota bacterium]|nr:type II secretion system F family protein [Planctomycetota bacterium]
MATTFTYRVKKQGGSAITGKLSAQSEGEAVAELRRQGFTIISLKATGAAGGEEKPGFFSLSVGSSRNHVSADKAKVKENEIVIFTRQMSTMIGAGIPLVESIEILAEQTSNPGFRKVLETISNEVRSGKDLSQALSAFPRVFPDIYVNMIKAGEASGQLDIVLSRLADYQEASAALKAEIKSAMTYPIVSLVLVLGISAFLLVVIIPKFQDMFYSMDVELPAITVGLLELSIFLKENVLLWMGGLVAAFFAVRAFVKTEKGQWTKDWVFLHLPIFGPLFQKVSISRFSRTFSTLIQSGVPILGALEIVAETSGNRIVASAINKASESVKQGETLGEPLAQSKVFPPMVTRMVSIGEKTGALEQLLEKISEFYDQQVKTTVDSLTSLIEPLMIAVMGVLVGGMVLAIFLPIFKMVGSLGA